MHDFHVGIFTFFDQALKKKYRLNKLQPYRHEPLKNMPEYVF